MHGRRLVHNPAVAQENHPVRPSCVPRFMGDEHDGGNGVRAGAEDLHDAMAGGGVQRTGGFVSQDQPPLAHDGPRNGDALLLAAGHLVHEAVREFRDAHLAEGVQRLPARFPGCCPVQFQRKSHVLGRGVSVGTRLKSWNT